MREMPCEIAENRSPSPALIILDASLLAHLGVSRCSPRYQFTRGARVRKYAPGYASDEDCQDQERPTRKPGLREELNEADETRFRGRNCCRYCRTLRHHERECARRHHQDRHVRAGHRSGRRIRRLRHQGRQARARSRQQGRRRARQAGRTDRRGRPDHQSRHRAGVLQARRAVRHRRLPRLDPFDPGPCDGARRAQARQARDDRRHRSEPHPHGQSVAVPLPPQ